MKDFSYNNQIGESEIFYSFQENLRKAASVDRSVLLIGERGSGKEFAASRLHYLSSRWKNSFIRLNCAALPPSLIESELFGHVKGAYTGADRERRGRFEESDGGTLFLDEIGLIPFEVQEKILRVVEYGTFERVGSSETKEVDVRIIGAANQDLPSLCREGKFKQDLLDRLSFEVLFVPPLRSRGEDIFVLADHFAQKMGKELGKKGRIQFADNVVRELNNYSWPGNIRELKNTVERAVYRADGIIIEEIVLNPFINPYTESGQAEKTAEGAEYRSNFVPDIGENRSKLYNEPESHDDFRETTGSVHARMKEVSGSGEGIPLSGSDSGMSFSKKILERLGKVLAEQTDKITADSNAADFSVITDIIKKELIATALEDCGKSQKKAAEMLKLSYDQFRGIYRKYFT